VLSEDGDEVDNVAINNIGILSKPPLKGQNSFQPVGSTNDEHSLQNEDDSSIFWMRNARQRIIGNRAAGAVMGNCYFFDVRDAPVQASKNIEKPGIFQDNVGHSSTRLWVFHPHQYHNFKGFGVLANKDTGACFRST